MKNEAIELAKVIGHAEGLFKCILIEIKYRTPFDTDAELIEKIKQMCEQSAEDINKKFKEAIKL